MILDYLLAHGWTPEDILATSLTLALSLAALAGAVALLEHLLKRADKERAEVYAPLDDLMDGQPPLPQRPHVHDWTTARALDEDQRDACCLCGQRREKSFDEHAAEALAMVACHPAANDSLDIADMALDADELVFAAEVLADIDDQPTYEGEAR